MTKVTFGVTSSPFLATATLRRIAQDYSKEHTTASFVSTTNFYVDDFLHEVKQYNFSVIGLKCS